MQGQARPESSKREEEGETGREKRLWRAVTQGGDRWKKKRLLKRRRKRRIGIRAFLPSKSVMAVQERIRAERECVWLTGKEREENNGQGVGEAKLSVV